MISAKKSLLSAVIASTFVILPSVSYADEFDKSLKGIIKRGTLTVAPIDKNVQGNLENLGVDPSNASLIADVTKGIKSASADISLLNNSVVVTQKTIDSLATKKDLINKLAKFAKNPNLANDLRTTSSKISGQLGQAKNITSVVGKFARNVTRVVASAEWGINMINSTGNFISNDNKELTDYTDIAMDTMSVTLIGGLTRDYIYKPIKGIGKANEEINDNKAKQVDVINKQVMRYIQGHAVAANIEYDLRNQKLDYSNISNSELDNYLAKKISQEAKKIDEVVVQLKKDAEMLKQKDAVFFFWNVDAGEYLAQTVGDYIYTLERHKERILKNKSERYNQYKDILIASISQDLIKKSNSELKIIDNDIKGLARNQKNLYADVVEIQKQLLTISEKSQENISNKENKSYIPDLNKENSSDKNFNPKDNKVDNLAIKQEILKKYGIDTSAQDTQEIATKKVIDKGAPSSGENSHDIAELKRALFDLTRTNKVLFGEYKEMKLDLEKAKWNDLYHASVSSQSISSKISKLNNIVSEINRYRGILDGNNNLSDSEKAATIPLTAHDRLVNDYVEKNIASYRADNDKAVAEKIAGIEKSLANTKATANYHSLEYSNLLKDIEKVRKELKAAGFKPTEANKTIVADSKKKINQWKAEAEKNRVQANIYIRKKLMEEKQLDYAKIDKYHYDGKKNTYQNAKSGLDQAYVGVKPNLIAKETLDTSYNELMAILGQPIVPTKPEPVETPKSEIRMTVLTDHKGLRSTTYHQFNKKDGQFYKSGSGDYQHLSWGTWKGNDSNDYETMHFGHYVEGQATVDLPTSGTASYKGSLSGDFRSRSTNTWEKDVFSGDVQLTANFNKRNIAIDLDLYKDGQSFEKINGTTDILAHDFLVPDPENRFTYDDKVGEIERVVSGLFYGPNAEEAGGTWGVFGHPSGKAFGSFRAKKNSNKKNSKQGFITAYENGTDGSRVASQYAELKNGSTLTQTEPYNNKIVTQFNNLGMKREDLTTEKQLNNDDYQYTYYGKWSSPDNTLKSRYYSDISTDSGYWLFGEATKELPKTGSANYLGDIHGTAKKYGKDFAELYGDIGIKADFASKKLAGILDIKQKTEYQGVINYSDYTKLKFSNASIGRNLNNNIPNDFNSIDLSAFFNARAYPIDESIAKIDNASGVEHHNIVSSNISGAFYGDGSEVGGTFVINGNALGNATGVFRAKKTTQSNELIPDNPTQPYSWLASESYAFTHRGEDGKEEAYEASSNWDYSYLKENSYDVKYDGYNYVGWGSWNDIGYRNEQATDGTALYSDSAKHFVYGNRTTYDDMPKIGTAVYTGNIKGDYVKQGLIEANSITGDISFNVNFANESLEGLLSAKHNGKNFATASFTGNNFNANKDLFGKNYEESGFWVNGDMKGGKMSLQGSFYGPNAEETAGSWDIKKTNEQASGIFRAKKQ